MECVQVILVTAAAGLVSAGHQDGQYNNGAGLSTSYGSPNTGYGDQDGQYNNGAGLSTNYGAPNSGYGDQGGQYNNGAGLSTNYGAPNSGYGGSGDDIGSRANNGGYGNGGNGYGGANNYDEQPKSYQFGYAVRDGASGNDYGRQETSDGHVVQGEYRVQLPDGRLQIVSYVADWRNGFRANVRYEGEAQYPATAPGGATTNRPVYGPPAYHQ